MTVFNGTFSNDTPQGVNENGTINAFSVQDLVSGGQGGDALPGGHGEGVLHPGPDNDRAERGNGCGRFTFDGVGNHTIIGGRDADGLDVDMLDLTGMRATHSGIEQTIICFTPGTRTATQRGEVAVERLQVGDKVITRDNGAQALRWVGRRDLTSDDMRANPEFQPILIRKGALCKSLPERDMLVLPQHRMLVTSDLAGAMFHEREVLIAARHLTGLDGVDQVQTGVVSYLHLMFDQHEVVLADGAWSESFQPGDHSLCGIGADQRSEVLHLFPELETFAGLDSYGAARLSLKRHEAEIIVDRLK